MLKMEIFPFKGVGHMNERDDFVFLKESGGDK